jgi:hypothetical protein
VDALLGVLHWLGRRVDVGVVVLVRTKAELTAAAAEAGRDTASSQRHRPHDRRAGARLTPAVGVVQRRRSPSSTTAGLPSSRLVLLLSLDDNSDLKGLLHRRLAKSHAASLSRTRDRRHEPTTDGMAPPSDTQQQQQHDQAVADLLAHERQLDPEKAVDRAEAAGELKAAAKTEVTPAHEPYAIYRRFSRPSRPAVSV